MKNKTALSVLIIVVILSCVFLVVSTKQTVLAHTLPGGVWGVVLNDKSGKPLTGDNNYTIHFKQEPPGTTFWYVVTANSTDVISGIIYSHGIKKNPDGSFDIYVQHQSPAKDKASNWLRSPEGSFALFLSGNPKSSYNATWPVPIVQRTG